MSDMEGVLYREKVVYRALQELDERLFKMHVKPFELNVVGGFAMTVEQIRMSDYTDIDYVGPTLPDHVREVIDEIGVQYGLGRGWVNNDVLLSGSTIEELETITGPLTFKHAFDLKIITVYVLDKECLLRMKLLAIDTSFSGFIDLNADFDRLKDFPDVESLMVACDFSYNDMVEENFDFVINPDIFYLIRYYLRTHDVVSIQDVKLAKRIIEMKGKLDDAP